MCYLEQPCPVVIDCSDRLSCGAFCHIVGQDGRCPETVEVNCNFPVGRFLARMASTGV